MRYTETLIIAPPNELPQIDEIWIAVSVDDNGEGICARTTTIQDMPVLMPLITSNERNVEALKQQAIRHGVATNSRMRIIKLSLREIVAEYDAQGNVVEAGG
jgi:hypothetical protein